MDKGTREPSLCPSASGNGHNVSYTYDLNGLRLSRTVDGTKTYSYAYIGDQLSEMTIDENGTVRRLSFVYDSTGPYAVTVTNGSSSTTYYYVLNLQGDVVAIVNGAGTAVVEYTYDPWGKLLSIDGAYKNGLGIRNPLRYRGYVYDTETQLYYLQSRYYDPTTCRFINADSFVFADQDILGNNTFAYCCNNPISRIDETGHWFDIFWDVVSLVVSVVEVVQNPTDVGAWVGLAMDAVDVLVPCVSGLGEATDAVNATRKTANAIDSVKAIDRTDDVVDIGKVATTGSPNDIGKVGEQLAGINPNAKTSIQVNGRTRIPDALTPSTLTEVKNVKYISNTSQLRDFATFAKNTGRTMELYVRPTTKIAQTVIDAGWDIKYLW